MSLLPSCTASAVEGTEYANYFVPANEYNAAIVYNNVEGLSLGSITGPEDLAVTLPIPAEGVGSYNVSLTVRSTTTDPVSTTDAVIISIVGNTKLSELYPLTGPQFLLGLGGPAGTKTGVNGLVYTPDPTTTALTIVISPVTYLSGSYNLYVDSIISLKAT